MDYGDELSELMEMLKLELNDSISHLKQEYQVIRAGRANPHILDKVCVNAYGANTPLNQVSNITVPEARIIMVNVWDQSLLKEAFKAIQAADLGVTASEDGKSIRLIFPVLTEERRKDIVKQIRKIGEDAKISFRNIRRECLDNATKLEKKNELSKDLVEIFQKDVQKQVDNANAEAEKLCTLKEKEIMEV